MGCEYNLTIDGKQVKRYSLEELTKYYYSSGAKLTNAKIFSSEEIVESTTRVITDLISRTQEILADTSKTPVTQFISDVNTQLYRSLGIKQDRLVPKYDEDARKLSFILTFIPAEYKQYKILSDLKNALVKDTENEDIYNEKLKEIEEVINTEKITLEFGKSIHKGLSQLLRGDNITDIVDRIMSKNGNILDNETQWRQAITTKLLSIHTELSTIITNGGVLYSDVPIDFSLSPNSGIKGEMDIVAIDKEGGIHIYDLKISKNPYSDWDQVKILSTDWQLAFYRGILGHHTDTSSATLNIIPLSVGKVENGKISVSNFNYSGQVPLLANPRKGLNVNGSLTLTVNLLIPQKIDVTFNPEKSVEFIENLKFLFPNYEIKTSKATFDVTKMVESAKKRGSFDIINNFNAESSDELTLDLERLGFKLQRNTNIYKYPWEPNTNPQEKEEKFTRAIEVYVEFAKKHKNNNLVSLKNSVISAINSGSKDLVWHNKLIQISLNRLLKSYLLGNHVVISKFKELDDMGIILLQNTLTQRFTLLSLSTFISLSSYNETLSYGDLEFMKSFLFLNTYFEELQLQRNKIENVLVFNLQSGQDYYADLETEFDKFNKIMQQRNLTPKLSKLSNLPAREDTAREVLMNHLHVYSADDKEKLTSIFAPIMSQMLDAPSETLKEVQKKFRELYPEIEKRTLEKLSFNDEKEYLYALLASLVIMKQNIIPIGDAVNMKNFALAFSDFKSVFSALYTDKQEEYDKNAKKIQGVIGGLNTITPDRVPSEDLKNINILIDSANSFIRQDFYKASTILGKLTRKYFSDINYSPTEANWLGNYRQKFTNFWVKEDGDVSNLWSVKNPYKFDSDNNLSDSEREYLKKMLFEMKKYNLGLEDAKDINIDSLETLKNSKGGLKILEFIESGKYFKMPLVLNQQTTRLALLWKDGFKRTFDKIKVFKDEFAEAFDPRELQNEERINLKQTELGYYEMFDIYDRQDDSFKKEMIDQKTPQYFELNLDILAHRYIFNKIRQKYMNEILPIVNSYMWWMKLRAGIGDKNISKELEYVASRVKLGVYGTTDVDEEAEDLIKVIAPLKSAVTLAVLALRPILFFKEMTIGLYKGITLASANVYGKKVFSHKSYLTAMLKLATVDKQLSTEWNLNDGINNFYGFANRDVNSAAQKMQTTRRGVLMGLSPWMYSANTIPDYYNRLSLFMAKMIEDGSYDAHSIIDGFLQYDVKKDARFTNYFANREKHKNSEGKYIPAAKDVVYNKERNLYNLILGEINEERARINRPKLVEETDLLTHAYSEKERLSFKSFTDTVYGYYDKASQAKLHSTWYGIIFFQFLQFLPGKMSMWFGKQQSAENSSFGDHVQKQLIKENGEVVLLWREPVYSEINTEEIVGFNEVETNTGDPALAWVGTPQEGLLSSMLKTIRYAATGDMGKFKSDQLLKNRVIYGIADGLLMMLIFGLLATWIKGWIAENGSDGIDGQTMAFLGQVNKRVLSEANIYMNTFGALKTTPVFLSYGTKIIGDIHDTMMGNKSIQDLSKLIKATELINLDA